MNNRSIWTAGRMTILFLIWVLAIDIGGAGTTLAMAAAKAQGLKIDYLAEP